MDLADNFLDIITGASVNWIQKNKAIDTEKIERIRYGVKSLLNEFFKLTILSCIFLLAGRFYEFFSGCFALILLRMYVGGTHRNTWFGCFFQSLFTFSVIVFLSVKLILPFYIICLICIVMIIWVWKKAPLVSKSRAAYSRLQRMEFKAKAFTVLLILIMLMPLLPVRAASAINWAIVAVLLDSMIAAVKDYIISRKPE